MKRLLLLAFSITLFFGQGKAQTERFTFDKGWRFHLGDIPNNGPAFSSIKTGWIFGPPSPEFKDSAWSQVTLPHDWVTEQPYDEKGNLEEGTRHRGIGWYRKSFKLDSSDAGKHIELQFDGIATQAIVWVNGIIVHRNFCGYTSSYIDITPMVELGKVNVITVRADASVEEGWFYEGGGIYRHAWLLKRNPLHVITDGIFANPVKKDKNNWVIPAQVTVENSGNKPASANVIVELVDPSGKTVAKESKSLNVGFLSTSIANVDLAYSNPKLWDINSPVLYKIKTTVLHEGNKVDEQTTTCGFRTIAFRADSGFFLNGRNLKIQGVCNHQDAGGVGVAIPDSLWTIRILKLKEMGINAIRTAHNPPAKEFLEACDNLGILVMDENRIFNSSPEYARQLEWLIRRDRNHPSIIMWSILNEEHLQGTPVGYEMARRMIKLVKSLDTTRPVTAAMNWGQFEPVNVAQVVDVVGFNYHMENYDRYHKAHPNTPLISTEDGSCLIVRGEYVTDTTKHIVDSYDTQKPSWGATHRHAWKTINDRPYIAGCFYWTGYDYHGEPTPYTWPTVSSNFGIMDLVGFPKSAYYLHKAQWRNDLDVMHVIPHWNWPADSIGKNIKVMTFSNAETVKLFLNKKLISEQKVDIEEMNTWYVPYKPGKLEAIGYVNGKEVSRHAVETTGAPKALRMKADQQGIDGDGLDVLTITVSCIDSKSREIPDIELPVTFTIEGPGKIIGLGNGDPNSHEPEKGNQRSLFNGLAQLIIQTTEGATSPVKITATSAGMEPYTLTIPVNSKKPQLPAL